MSPDDFAQMTEEELNAYTAQSGLDAQIRQSQAEQERDRYIEAILGGRLRFHLNRIVGAMFAPEPNYPYWREVHRRWLELTQR